MVAKVSSPRVKADLCLLASELKFSRDAHSRHYVLAAGRRSGFEHLVCYCGKNGKLVVRHTDRAVDCVGLPRLHLARAKTKRERLVIHHNHPSGLALSVADVRHLLERPGLLEIFAHGHDGSWYWATSRRIRDGVEMIQHGELAFIKGIRSLGARGVFFNEALGPHLFNVALERAGMIRYRYELSNAVEDRLKSVSKLHAIWLFDLVKKTIEKARR
ncbi:hypothetical protein [Herbaspirillum sp. NPDC087042]|uniref:hypothetical protein n=1 Tax=Herbaspirillum sp. NPDC087042 TaxID=3364004 RepID=UPI003823D9FE